MTMAEATPSPSPSGTNASGSFVGRRNNGNLAGSRRLTVETKSRLIGDYIDKVVKEVSPDSPQGQSCKPKQHPASTVQTPGMVLSIWGSATTDEDKFIPYFAQKGIHFDGDFDKCAHRVGLMSHRGYKPDSPNQDDFFMLSRPESLLLGVFDGHGPEGHEVAHFAQERLPTLVTERLRKDGNWEEAIKASVEELCTAMQEKLAKVSQFSGATMTVGLLDRQPVTSTAALTEQVPMRFRCAFLGDSIACWGKRRSNKDGPYGPWMVNQLTSIHRPDREDEAARIDSLGGKIVREESTGNARLSTPDYNLAISRSLADFHATAYGLSSQPELVPAVELETGFEHIIMICSDGIWDVITPVQAIQFVGKFKPTEAQLAAERLVSKAQLRWQEAQEVVDDITCIIVWPNFEAVGRCFSKPSTEASTAEPPAEASSASGSTPKEDNTKEN